MLQLIAAHCKSLLEFTKHMKLTITHTVTAHSIVFMLYQRNVICLTSAQHMHVYHIC